MILLNGSNWDQHIFTDKQASGIISVSNTLLGNELVSDELTLRRIHSVRGLSFLAKVNLIRQRIYESFSIQNSIVSA